MKNNIPFNQYQSNGLDMLSEANQFNQCDCNYCTKLKHTTTVLMNYLRVAGDLQSLADKVDIGYVDELVELYTYYYHCKLSCNIIKNVINSIEATIDYYNYKYNCYYVAVQVTSVAELNRIKQYYINAGYWLENKNNSN